MSKLETVPQELQFESICYFLPLNTSGNSILSVHLKLVGIPY